MKKGMVNCSPCGAILDPSLRHSHSAFASESWTRFSHSAQEESGGAALPCPLAVRAPPTGEARSTTKAHVTVETRLQRHSRVPLEMSITVRPTNEAK